LILVSGATTDGGEEPAVMKHIENAFSDRLPAGRQAPVPARYTGALLGGAMGDALGRPNEGTRQKRVPPLIDYVPWRGWQEGPKGTITDDTQLTMCVAECLICHGRIDPEELARRFVTWLPEGRGKGRTTVAAVERLRHGIPWYLAGEDSAGNGAAMRAAPIGLAWWYDPPRLRAEAILSALPTHRSPMAVAGAVAIAAATAWLLTCDPAAWSPEEFIAAIQSAIAGMETDPLPERRDPSVRTTLHDRLGELPALLDDEPDAVLSRLYSGAYVLESLPAALYCFLRTPHDVETTLILAANAGHDADTVAAMAGTLGGALGGEDALPQRLLKELEHAHDLRAFGKALHALAMTGDATQSIRGVDRIGPPSIANSDLSVNDLPPQDTDLETIINELGLTFNAYELWGADWCPQVADRCRQAFTTEGRFPASLTELRTWLFMEQRGWRWDGWSHPTEEVDGPVLRGLAERIRYHVRVRLMRGSTSIG
jgi:ADP-ribosylglycohydrolase